MKKIPLTRNQFALVDNDSFEFINQFCCWYGDDGYARIGIPENGKKVTRLLHRIILNAPANLEVDHINGNRLDNRKVNLRLVTRTQNAMNQSKHIDNTSGYKGVVWHTQINKWQARIQAKGKRHNLGVFDCVIEAAKAYNKAAIELHGEYAKLNDLEATE